VSRGETHRYIPLTQRLCLIYRCMSVRMPTSPPVRNKSAGTPWRAGFCLLLAALLFYNPFLTILSASDIIHVRHPFSYRATVASSELGRCKLDSVQPLVPALAVQPVDSLTLIAPIQTGERAASRVFFRSVAQLSSNCLWFRPPPAL
jgi:hypothetical protein